eukprot:m51a1_g6278 hypothetical protein (324) ;mRNA; r:194097-196461
MGNNRSHTGTPRGWTTSLLLVLLALLGVDAVAGLAGRVAVVVAHPDDDLLFLAPDLIHDLRSGGAVLTVTMAYEVRGRYDGIRDAYASVCGVPSSWRSYGRTVLGRHVLFSSLAGTNVTLAYMLLPDGHVMSLLSEAGQGDERGWLLALDMRGLYAFQDLADTLAVVLSTFAPDVVRTMNYVLPLSSDLEHSDHLATAHVARAASHSRIVPPHVLVSYEAYTITWHADNVGAQDAADKYRSVMQYLRTSTRNASVELADWFPTEWTRRQYIADVSNRTEYWDRETMDGDPGSLSGRDAFTGQHPRAVLFRGFCYVFYSDRTKH